MASEHRSQDDHISLPPPFELHEPLGPQQNRQESYYNGFEGPSHRDTYATDGSNHSRQDGERNHGQRSYRSYGAFSLVTQQHPS